MALQPGFGDPVHDAQACFRRLMEAFSRPGLPTRLPIDLAPPAPMTAELAAVALTLADRDAPLWLDAPLAASPDVAAYLRFHTGAVIASRPEEAAFALVADPASAPDLSVFAQGLDAYPDRSTTVVMAVESVEIALGGFSLRGPGVKGEQRLAIEPWTDGLLAQLRSNAAQFPRGVDLLFVAPGRVAALPRSTQVSEAA